MTNMHNEILASHYHSLYESSKNILINLHANEGKETNTLYYDPIINNTDEDERYGITLILRPPSDTQSICFQKISNFLNDLREAFPDQYVYPYKDLHITLLSIISCHVGFIVKDISISAYVAVVEDVLRDFPTQKIGIRLRGVTMSPSCIMLQGYLADETCDLLNDLRNRLRKAFGDHVELQQSINQRYLLTTAHITVARLCQPLRQDVDKDNLTAYLQFLDQHRDTDFGEFTISSIQLVGNDWYMLSKKLQLLHQFSLQ